MLESELSATTLLSGRVMLTCSPSWVVISVSGIAAYCLFSLYIIPIITMQIGRAIAAAIWVHLRTRFRVNCLRVPICS